VHGVRNVPEAGNVLEACSVHGVRNVLEACNVHGVRSVQGYEVRPTEHHRSRPLSVGWARASLESGQTSCPPRSPISVNGS
jgi:hypothetical protein